MVRRFEVWIVRLDPTLGAEIGKTRPSVIISPDEANDALRTVIVAPLTSQRRAWPTRVAVNVNKIAGDVALDQLRAVDKRRLAQRVGVLAEAEARAVLERLAEMFAGLAALVLAAQRSLNDRKKYARARRSDKRRRRLSLNPNGPVPIRKAVQVHFYALDS